jgi:hypothetical protein
MWQKNMNVRLAWSLFWVYVYLLIGGSILASYEEEVEASLAREYGRGQAVVDRLFLDAVSPNHRQQIPLRHVQDESEVYFDELGFIPLDNATFYEVKVETPLPPGVTASRTRSWRSSLGRASPAPRPSPMTW